MFPIPIVAQRCVLNQLTLVSSLPPFQSSKRFRYYECRQQTEDRIRICGLCFAASDAFITIWRFIERLCGKLNACPIPLCYALRSPSHSNQTKSDLRLCIFSLYFVYSLYIGQSLVLHWQPTTHGRLRHAYRIKRRISFIVPNRLYNL